LFGFDSGGRAAGDRSLEPGQTQTTGPTPRHRRPVGSHAAVTPANPAAPGWSSRTEIDTAKAVEVVSTDPSGRRREMRVVRWVP